MTQSACKGQTRRLEDLAEYAVHALPHRGDEIFSQPGEDFAGDLGGDDLAGLAGLLEVAAEEDVASLADEELVVAASVFPLLRRVGAALSQQWAEP